MPGFFQDSFQAVETTSANAYFVSDSKKRMQRTRDVLSQQPLQIIDLPVGNWNRRSAKGDQPDDAFVFQELFRDESRPVKPNEQITGKERSFQALLPVAPAMGCPEQGKKCLPTLVLKVSSYSSFEPITGLNGIPRCQAGRDGVSCAGHVST